MARSVTKLMTPKGTLLYPHLSEPDTKFDADGVYTTKLVVPVEEAQAFMKKVGAIVDAAFENYAADNKAKAKKASAIYPWTEELDAEGEETGNIVFNFKLKAKGTDGKKTWDNNVTMLDSKGAPVDGLNPWTGTAAKLGVEVGDPAFPYANPAGVGVAIRLKVVQIIELVSGGGNGAAGFDVEEEDGFVAAEKAAAADFDDDEEDF